MESRLLAREREGDSDGMPQSEQSALLMVLSCTYHIYGRYQNIRGKEINKIK